MIYAPARRPGRLQLPSEKVLRRALYLGAAAAVAGSVASGKASYVAALAGVLAIALAAWSRPGWALVTFAALVPVNRVVILLFFHATHSYSATTMLQLWKDGLMAVLLARVLYDLLFARRQTRVYLLDLILLSFVALGLAYLIWPGTILGIDFITRLTAFRSDVYFLVAYFVGRQLVVSRRQLRLTFLGLIPGSLLVALVAVWQFGNPAQANALFASWDFADFIKTEGAEAVRARGLAGQNLPRASSLLLGDLALAFYQLIMCSVAAALCFERSLRRHAVLAGGLLLAMLATLMLTVTRSAVIAAAPALLLMAVVGRGVLKLALVLTALALLGGSIFVASHLEPSTVQQLLSLEEASVLGHEGALQRSLDDIQAEPFGQGFGTAGMVGQIDAHGQGITNENWYLQIATEIGVLPAALYLAAVVTVAVRSLIVYFRVADPWLRVLTLSMTGTAAAYLVVGNTLHAFEVPVISMLFWVLAGLAVRAKELEADPTYLEER